MPLYIDQDLRYMKQRKTILFLAEKSSHENNAC